MDLRKGGGHGVSRFSLSNVDGHLSLLRETRSWALETLKRCLTDFSDSLGVANENWRMESGICR
jgi:hypothetical protein